MRLELEDLMDLNLPIHLTTGGPCSGKSTFIRNLPSILASDGVRILSAPEAATYAMSHSGMSGQQLQRMRNDNPSAYFDFEIGLAKFQLAQEQHIAWQMKNVFGGERTLGILDRGINDLKCYLDTEQYSRFSKVNMLSDAVTSWRYPVVRHLVSAAVGAESYYTRANNASRREDIDEAAAMDLETLQAYVGHPHLEIFDNSTNWEGKMARLVRSVRTSLGLETPYEIERKWLLKSAPSQQLLDQLKAVPVSVRQYYAQSKAGEIVRYRQWGSEPDAVYLKTIKRHVSPGTAEEYETRISQREYYTNLSRRDTKLKMIDKTRWCFVYNYQYFALDQFRIPAGVGWLLELEVDRLDRIIILPPELSLTEVTGDKRYSNSAIAAA